MRSTHHRRDRVVAFARLDVLGWYDVVELDAVEAAGHAATPARTL